MGTDAASVSPVFAAVLRSGRDYYNAQFAVARHQFGELDSAAFAEYLRQVADPLVCATATIAPESVASVANAAYEVGLELVGQRLYGPTARHPYLNDGFAKLLCAYAVQVAAAPLQVLAALGNALHNLATTVGARPDQFVQEMLRVAEHVSSLGALLTVGQVQAWRTGFAHFREGALTGLSTLAEPLARAAIGARAGTALAETIGHLRRDPWYVPSSGDRHRGMWVGSFRGFGGLFGMPPIVRATGAQILVQSAGLHWVLLADQFGATFLHANDAELRDALPARKISRLLVDSGRLRLDGTLLDWPARGELTSAVEVAGTLAVTFSLSHAILLLPGVLQS